MQYLKLRKYMVMVDDADVDIMRQIMQEMDNTLLEKSEARINKL